LFGWEASVRGCIAEQIKQTSPLKGDWHFIWCKEDIRDCEAIHKEFSAHQNIAAVIHCAAQPSHDWAASDPITDFDINARGTLNLLEATRKYCPQATFVYMSTNKVYGDRPNSLWPITDDGIRFDHVYNYEDGYEDSIDETMPVDSCLHSLFGCSKLAADLYVQEYGRYFGMNTVCFRGGCLTGPAHAGTKLHGFLSYLVKCCVTGEPYEVIGYGGKQVRDNIHSADLVTAFDLFIQNPKPGAVYNIGGGRENSCSVLEAIALAEEVTGRKMQVTFKDEPRIGDHKWWITDTSKFRADYPEWRITKSLRQIVEEIAAAFERKAVA
jgi:CDP-paratose 2-epimerase